MIAVQAVYTLFASLCCAAKEASIFTIELRTYTLTQFNYSSSRVARTKRMVRANEVTVDVPHPCRGAGGDSY
jgi:hypothetical protein